MRYNEGGSMGRVHSTKYLYKNLETSSTSNLPAHMKALEQKELTFKRNIQQEIIKLSTEIHKNRNKN